MEKKKTNIIISADNYALLKKYFTDKCEDVGQSQVKWLERVNPDDISKYYRDKVESWKSAKSGRPAFFLNRKFFSAPVRDAGKFNVIFKPAVDETAGFFVASVNWSDKTSSGKQVISITCFPAQKSERNGFISLYWFFEFAGVIGGNGRYPYGIKEGINPEEKYVYIKSSSRLSNSLIIFAGNIGEKLEFFVDRVGLRTGKMYTENHVICDF